ncbi:MAG: DnaJ domain-containing protein [Chloroflexota bacterium]
MKDYYHILGVPENAGQREIKQAFRKLAFQYHPDKNPGREKEAEERFKEINEAYCILGDEPKRQQYDAARRGGFGLYGQPGFGYTQQDIFRDGFANRNLYEEINRMFSQGGLRFDNDFLNQVFFNRGIIFQFFTGSGASPHRYAAADSSPAPKAAAPYRPNWLERFLGKIFAGVMGFLLRRLFGVRGGSLDYHTDIEVTADEAAAGAEKEFSYQRDGQSKRLIVKIPARVKPGTKIRLKGMGIASPFRTGDLYLHVKVRA